MVRGAAEGAVRPDWPDIWMEMARLVARRSLCVRAQCGCVIVTANNQVVATGYNGPPKNFEHGGLPCTEWCDRPRTGGGPAGYDDCVTSHAEMNALVTGDRTRYEGGTMYCTRVPCFTCAKVIANSGIKWVYYLTDRPEDMDREPDKSITFLRRCGVVCIPVSS